uniref:Uncharacterized protein n=1 Tax=Sorghum bicolor TaxID=4558 RepID=Q9XE69_SORBI|nr:hypothetical protein [Sorghum bicolor]
MAKPEGATGSPVTCATKPGEAGMARAKGAAAIDDARPGLSGQGGKGGGRGLAGRAGRPAGGGLLAAKVLLGRGLALGSAQSARKRALVAVYSCSRSTAGWWTVGSVLVDSDHLLSSYLRFAVHQVQIGLPLHLRTARAARRVVCAAVFVQNCVWAGAKGVQGGALDLSPVCNAGARACSRRPCSGAPAVPRGGLAGSGVLPTPSVRDTCGARVWDGHEEAKNGALSEPCRATVAGKGKKMAAAVSYAPASWASGAVVPSSPCPSLARSARGVAAEPWCGGGVVRVWGRGVVADALAPPNRARPVKTGRLVASPWQGGVGGKKTEEAGGKRWKMTCGGHLSSARGGCWARLAARPAGVRARCGARAGPRAWCWLARCWAGAGPRQSALVGRGGAWAAGDASAGGVLVRAARWCWAADWPRAKLGRKPVSYFFPSLT